MYVRVLQTKCIQYWPDEGSFTFGKIVVALNETEPFSDFIIRTFQVAKVYVDFIVKYVKQRFR